jgi:hypothetical protein
MPSFVGTLFYVLGLFGIFVGERLIGSGSWRWVSGFGLAWIVGAVGSRALRAARAEGDRRGVERGFLALYGLGLLALALYFAQSDLSGVLLDKPLDRGWPKLAGAFSAVWPALLVAAMAPTFLMEMAYAAMARAPRVEVGKIRDAALSGLGLAGALTFAFAITYVATERDKKADLSYFRTARAGESTRNIVKTLDNPVRVALFFPPANEVREEVEGYFNDLAKESKLLEVSRYDHAIDRGTAQDLGVTGNGTVVIARDKKKEMLSLGLDLESARGQLGNLDKEVQKRLLVVARPPRTVYLTTGHGERTDAPTGDTDKRLTARDLRDLLRSQSYTVKDLGAAEGLASEVPADAASVLVLGPQKPLLPEEIRALTRYFDRGGRLFIALDPEAGMDMKDLLGPLGVKFTPVPLAHDQNIARKSNQQSDRWNIVTGNFSSHASVTTLGRLGGRAPMVFIGAGALEELKDKAKELSVNFTVHAHAGTWNDANANYNFDPPAESKKPWELAAAIVKKPKPDAKPTEEGRAIVIGDSDVLCDGVIAAYGNPGFALDGMKWLHGDESIAGEITSESDAPIAHTKKQDIVWFYGSTFAAPLLAIGVGFLATRRRRARKGGAR